MHHDFLTIDITANAGEMTAAEVAINDQLARVNEELDRYTCKASMFDYALAVASGVMAGVVDATYVGETAFFSPKGDTGFAHIADATGAHAESSKAPGFRSPVGSDNLNVLLKMGLEYARKNVSLTDDANKKANRFLRQMSRQHNAQGLAAAIAIQLLRIATQVSVAADRDVQPLTAYIDQAKELLIPAAIVGFLNWLDALSTRRPELKDCLESEDNLDYKALIELAIAAAGSKAFDSLVKEANTWFDKRTKEALRLNRKPAKGFDVSLTLLSLLRDVADKPSLKNSGLSAEIGKCEQMYVASHKSGSFGGLTKQAIPVLLNEVIVRMGYFATRLISASTSEGIVQGVNWADAIPIGNRTVDRMMTFASMTLMLVDTSDAAAHASVESAGYWVVYAQRFVARYNYVAAGRAVIAVTREVSNEVREAQLIREKRLLSEARTVLTIERLEEYKAQLAERFEDYLVENLTAFSEGLSQIDKGLADGNSDNVIAGNVIIQRALGHEVQFTNQDEFDALMESDSDFVF